MKCLDFYYYDQTLPALMVDIEVCGISPKLETRLWFDGHLWVVGFHIEEHNHDN